MKRRNWLYLTLCEALLFLLLCGCSWGVASLAEDAEAASRIPDATSVPASEAPAVVLPEETPAPEMATGPIAEQVLDSPEGEIHYSYNLPEGYNPSDSYPLVVVMPGYDRMWFGESSSGRNLDWRGFQVWTELEEALIVVSAQLTDWGETSARQAIALTEYFLENFAVDASRVYAAGYSAGGETMSRAVSMRPDLYAAYLHGASQWDGDYAPVAEAEVAVYIFIAENDEYYGSQQARDTYGGLYEAYADLGWSQAEIDEVLRLEIPDDAYFHERGIYGNYHGGGNVLFEDTSILQWILSHHK